MVVFAVSSGKHASAVAMSPRTSGNHFCAGVAYRGRTPATRPSLGIETLHQGRRSHVISAVPVMTGSLFSRDKSEGTPSLPGSRVPRKLGETLAAITPAQRIQSASSVTVLPVHLPVNTMYIASRSSDRIEVRTASFFLNRIINIWSVFLREISL